MRLEAGQIYLSASDLMRFQGCAHATALDLRYLQGEPLTPVEDSADARLLQEKGELHEQDFLESLRSKGHSVAVIDKDEMPFSEAVERTRELLRQGPDYIYQGAFASGVWGGFSDFLERVERPSRLGPFSYEIIDTKLKRTPDPKHILQLALYGELLAEDQGVRPESVHIVLGDGRRASLRLTEYLAYTNLARDRLESFVSARWPTRPEPVTACSLCRWRDHCAAQWDREDNLCLVAGITKNQRLKLEGTGVDSLEALSTREARVPKLADTTLAKLRTQARLQHARRQGSGPRFELRPLEPDRGLLRLPCPSPHDLFFDIEGDPYVEGGLEYLFGLYLDDPDGGQFQVILAHDREQEREATRNILDLFRNHLTSHPDAHIYHYGHYEVVALKRLSSSYGVGEASLDHLLREQRFVNLHQIVGSGLVASEPGYSLKDLEVFYMEARTDELSSGMESVIAYEEWRDIRDASILENIRRYNETDCRSTKYLRDWLTDEVRPPDLPWFVTSGIAGETATDDAATLQAEAEREVLRRRIDAVHDRIGPEVADLILELTWFHQREDKPQWWAMFDRAEKETDELIDDLESLGGLEAIASAQPVKRSQVRRYRFPEQETKMRADTTVRVRDSLSTVTLSGLDMRNLEAGVRFGPKAGDPPERIDLVPGGPIRNEVLREAVRRVVEDMVEGNGRYSALEDLLYRRHPRLTGKGAGEPILEEGTGVVAGTVAALRDLDESYMPVQGPPGTGKTYVSSHAILDLIGTGARVGISSNSHKAIDNLLKAVANRAREEGVELQAIKKISPGGEGPDDPDIDATTSNDDGRLFSWPVVGGTAWLFARPDHDQAFDYLFVDEAGQVSLANLLAMGTAAKNIVLVGDPMQLSQPIQGAHPGETGLSALEYALGDHATIPPDRGIFLPVSRRMHQAICQYISDLVYEGRLRSDEGASRQRLVLSHSHPGLSPVGLRFVDVAHEGNSQSSAEEAEAVAYAYQALLRQQFSDRDGHLYKISADDVLVVAPYNAQVNLLLRTLPTGARVGTIDKFQGQEAPVCLISMATSSGDDLPRDIAFLFSVNRLNVAISRAQALAMVFASPKLLDVPCKTIDEMRLVNALCAVHQYSSTLSQNDNGRKGAVS